MSIGVVNRLAFFESASELASVLSINFYQNLDYVVAL